MAGTTSAFSYTQQGPVGSGNGGQQDSAAMTGAAMKTGALGDDCRLTHAEGSDADAMVQHTTRDPRRRRSRVRVQRWCSRRHVTLGDEGHVRGCSGRRASLGDEGRARMVEQERRCTRRRRHGAAGYNEHGQGWTRSCPASRGQGELYRVLKAAGQS